MLLLRTARSAGPADSMPRSAVSRFGNVHGQAGKFDAAVLLIHHTRKGADGGDAEAISGASAIVNLARRAIMPIAMTTDEAKALGVLPSERSRYIKLVDAKSNLAPRSADTPWYRLHSVELPNPEPPVYPHGDNVQAIVRVNLSTLSNAAAAGDDQQVRAVILKLIRNGKIIDGKSYPYSPATLAPVGSARSFRMLSMRYLRQAFWETGRTLKTSRRSSSARLRKWKLMK